ncbi:sugar phosphate isomerase/epimerase [soil metagenome]
MTTRRSFLKTSAVLSAGLLVAPELFAYNKMYIGLQLYTVRDAMGKDPLASLAKVAQIGYTSVEGATYTGSEKFYGMNAMQFAKVLKDNGLIMPSAHYRLGEEKMNGQDTQGTLMHDWQRAVDDAAAVGVKYMVCAYLSQPERGDLSHYKKIAEEFNKAGEICKKSGIQLCYHNHDFEFEKQDGKYPYEVLLMHSDEHLVKMEMDIYWVTKAKQNPVELFKRYPGRFPLWHVKDMDNTPKKMFTEVGNGTINFKEIFEHSKKAGLKYFFVEQDICPGDPFDSITKSITYIKANLV